MAVKAGSASFQGTEEILIGSFGLCSVPLQSIGAAQAEMGKIVGKIERIDAAVRENFLIFGGGGVRAILQLQVGFRQQEIDVAL